MGEAWLVAKSEGGIGDLLKRKFVQFFLNQYFHQLYRNSQIPMADCEVHKLWERNHCFLDG